MNTLQKGSFLCQGKWTFAWKGKGLSSNELLATVLMRIENDHYYGEHTEIAVLNYLRPSRPGLKPFELT